jgi:uncharacterized protein HemX
MWQKIKGWVAALLTVIAAILGGAFWFARKKQSDGGKSALTPTKQKEIDTIEQQKQFASVEIKQNHVSIDALSAAIKANDGKLEGISQEVQGMTNEQVVAELKLRGLS